MADIVFLNVPYSDKDKAKAFGAKWNPQRHLWYVPAIRLARKKLSEDMPSLTDVIQTADKHRFQVDEIH